MSTSISTEAQWSCTPFLQGAGKLLSLVILLQSSSAPLRAQERLGGLPVLSDAFLQVQNTVVEASPALAASRASLAAAQARLQGAGLSPPVVLSAEIEDVPGGYDLTGASVRMEVGREFVTGGRSTAARALASAEVGVVTARMDALERRIRGGVLLGLTRLGTAQAVARRLASEDLLLTSTYASVLDRFSTGTARYVDILRVQTEQLRVRTEMATALAEEGAALEGLLGLVGPERRPEILELVSDPGLAGALDEIGPLPLPPPLDSLVALAAAVTLAQGTVDLTRAARDVVVAERGTRFAASIGAQRFSELEGGSIGPVLGGSLTLPFTSGRANSAARRAAERDLEAAEAVEVAERSRVRGVIAAEVARYEAARERLEVYDVALLTAAREARESALGSYRTGDLSLVELLDFERAVALAEVERLRARASAIEALANLISGSAGLAGGEVH